MSSLSINQQSSGGQLYQLKVQTSFKLQDILKEGHVIGATSQPIKLNPTLKEIVIQGQKDGLDQVYLEAEGRYYMAEGDGLNLSALKSRSLPQAQIKLEGQTKAATIVATDNETNTAWEGVKAVGQGALGLATLGLGGAALTGVGFVQVNRGLVLAQSGATVIQQGVNTVATQIIAAKAQVTTLETIKQLPNLLQKSFNNLLPGMKVTQAIKTGSPVPLQQAVQAAQEGAGVIEKALPLQGAEMAAKGTSLIRTGLYISAGALAVAGTVTLGGAIYGASRGQSLEQMKEFRKQRIE